MATIYTFASSAPARLFAFSGDASGSSLPEQHGPWESVGKIRAGEKIPNQLDRARIEEAINEHGYQMWRIKKAAQPA